MNDLIIIAALILLNGVLAMAEMAIISVRKSQLQSLVKKGNKAAKTAIKLVEQPERFLSTIQIGITIIGILTGLFSSKALSEKLAEQFLTWGVALSASHTLAQITIILIVTYFTLVFGELVPKRIAMTMSERAAIIVAQPMQILSLLTAPFVWLLAKSTKIITHLFKLDKQHNTVTEAEIKTLIDEGTENGTVQLVERNIMKRVLQLGDLKVKSLMTHRSEIVCLDEHMSKQQVADKIEGHLFEMYPVMKENLDHIVGIVTLKQLMLHLHKSSFSLQEIVTAPYVVHENMSIYKVLELMKVEKNEQVLICDEFGNFQGILTLKDILHGLVGEIKEYDNDNYIVEHSTPSQWLVDARCPLYDFRHFFHIEDSENIKTHCNCNTIGGLIIHQLQHIPKEQETIHWNHFQFKIITMKGARIGKILVSIQLDDKGGIKEGV